MKIIVKWTIKTPTPISSISVDQVHNKLIVGLGKKIIYYDAVNGKELILYLIFLERFYIWKKSLYKQLSA